MDKNTNSKLAEIIKSLKQAVDRGDLGALVNGVAALEELEAESQPRASARPTHWMKQELAQLAEDGLIQQEGKEYKLTPQGKLTAQLKELIGVERLERLHHLADAKEGQKEYGQLLRAIVDDLAPILAWLALNRLLEVRDYKGRLLLCVWLTKKGASE